MTSDWGAYCTSNDLAIDGDQITVSFTDERSHRVTVTEEPHQLHLEAIVVRPATVRSLKADLAALKEGPGVLPPPNVIDAPFNQTRHRHQFKVPSDRPPRRRDRAFCRLQMSSTRLYRGEGQA